MHTVQLERMGDDLTVIERKINRMNKGVNLSDQVEILDESTARVYSQYDKCKSYIVDYVKKTCTCPDHIFRNVKCGHIFAVDVVLKLERCEN